MERHGAGTGVKVEPSGGGAGAGAGVAGGSAAQHHEDLELGTRSPYLHVGNSSLVFSCVEVSFLSFCVFAFFICSRLLFSIAKVQSQIQPPKKNQKAQCR